MIRKLWRRLRPDRRWISDLAERDVHDHKMRERLPRQPAPDDRGADDELPDIAPREHS